MNGGVPGSSTRVYDVANESDALALLQAVRHSVLDPETKDSVRDLIFALRTKANPEQQAELQMQLDPVGIKITAQTVASPESPAPKTAAPEAPAGDPKPVENPVAPAQSGFRSARPAPSFGTAPATAPSVAHAPQAASPSPDPVPEPAVEELSTPTPPTATETTPEPKTEPAPPSQAETPAAPSGDPMTRIKEIKSIVNQAVGNPVNLIDADNTVGKEYMTALLEAMKAVGGEGNVAPAMQRLETAFKAVEITLESGAVATPAAQPAPQAAPPPVGETSREPATPVTPAEPKATTPPAVAPESPEVATLEPAVSPQPEPAVAPVADSPQVVETPKPATPAAESAAPPTPLQSVAATSAQAPTAPTPTTETATKAPTSSDPLESEAVEAGLNELLQAWPLFKSSGLLRTGAKGAAHPLYKELKNLQMNAVIAGRYEGATPEVRQAITDYMNGWRYEHGMTHDMQETFEHYLRRVIKTIIDKQPK